MQSHSKPVRQELSDYDESLLLDRSYVHIPPDGFGDDAAEEGVADAEERASPVRSTAVAVFCFLGCLCGYVALLFVHLDDDPVDDFEIKAAAHLAALVLALGLESFLRVQHRRQQQAGYLAFYWRTRGLLSIPTRAAALAQGALTLISFWPDAPPWPGQLDKLRVVAGLELATVTAFACAYALRVRRHIREAVPDAQTYLRTSVYTAPTVPLRRGAAAVVEHQAEVVRWLTRRCHNLQREVLRLSLARESCAPSACMQAYREEEGSGGGSGAAREDLEHRLAARERELRALAAESDALQAQARAAWQSLDERSAAAHELEVRVRQQGEENGRLRATLEEWSHRNARLEARLNRTRERLDAANSLLARRSAAGASEAAPGEERDA